MRAERSAVALAAAALGLAVAPCPSATAYVTGGATWPGRPARITYWNGTSYRAEVRAAVRAWNRSGAGVRFVAVPRPQARVPITAVRDGSLGGAAEPLGFASIGAQPRSYVHLAPPARGRTRDLMATIVAHELGHVLGLDHEQRRCAAMNAPVWLGCGRVPPCSLLTADDVRGAIARYGGRPRRPAPELCPRPPDRLQVEPVAGAYDMEVTARVPAGAGIATRVARGSSCPRAPLARPAGATTATATRETTGIALDLGPDPAAFRGRPFCVSVWSQDERGRRSVRPATLRFTGAAAPLPPPSAAAIVLRNYGFAATWTGVRHVAASAYEIAFQPGDACPARPEDADAEHRSTIPAELARTSASFGVDRRGRVCVALWTRDRFGTLSAPVALHADVTGNRDPIAGFVTDPLEPIAGTAVTFTDGSTDPENALTGWAWEFGDPASGSANGAATRTATHVFALPGTYTVTLRVTDDGGATAETAADVVVGAATP